MSTGSIVGVWVRALLAAMTFVGFACGRIGYESREGGDAGQSPDATRTPDAGQSPDATRTPDARAASDAATMPDAGAECPSEMLEIVGPTGPFCIDSSEAGTVTWLEADSACAATAKRLCTDVEWYAACVSGGQALMGMTGAWEWVADLVDPSTAKKRGSSTCESTASHAIDSGGYQFRCCSDLDG